jgi:hypothetical protein
MKPPRINVFFEAYACLTVLERRTYNRSLLITAPHQAID